MNEVPPNAMDEIRSWLRQGNRLLMVSYTKPIIITAKTFFSWEDTGAWYIKPRDNGYQLRTGRKSSVYVLPGQLKFII
jgi:hypothetical protein